MRRITKSIFSLVFFALILTLSAEAQRVRFPITFENIVPGETKVFLFTFTGDPYATDSLDTALGEKEIPNIPLPGNIFYVWTVAPIQEPLWLSPNEVLKTPVGESGLVVHDVRVNWNGGRLELIWRQPIPSQIDSIWVTDGFSEWPDNFLKQKVVPGERFISENPAITRLRVMIWYNGTPTSVEEENTQTSIQLTPNPVIDRLSISNMVNGPKTIRLFDLSGTTVSTSLVEQEHTSIDVSSYAPGLYVVSVSDSFGTTTTLPFVKQ